MINETFFIALATGVFFIFFGRTLYRALQDIIDKRIQSIREQLQEAESLQKEAQNLLEIAQEKQKMAYQEAEKIRDHAQAEAELLKQNALKECEMLLERREIMALERIQQLEDSISQNLRHLISHMTVEAAEHLLTLEKKPSSQEIEEDIYNNIAQYQKKKKSIH